jgi:preprotein translocase subunit YajC
VFAQENLGTAAADAAAAPAAGGADPFSAAGCGASQGGTLSMVIWLVLLFGLMYFMLIRPQKKQREAHQKLMDSLKKGDRVVTSGGLLGTIVGLAEGHAILDTFEGTKVRIQKAHITGLQTDPSAKGNENEKK